MASHEKAKRKILAINAFDGGSHRQFIQNVRKHSCFDWHIISGAPVHWKWRMRSAPLQLAAEATRWMREHGLPDLLFCTDMLDLPCWRGMIRDFRVGDLPTVIYFHENQFTYPTAPESREDFHYAYTNLLSAIAADRCVFNSAFHQQDFFLACRSFLKRVPDGAQLHDVDELERKSAVVYPGFSPPDPPLIENNQAMVDTLQAEPSNPSHTTLDSTDSSVNQPLRIGWVSRWEHDKRPDRFLQCLIQLESQQVDFQLILLGNRPPRGNESLQEIQQRFANRIVCDQFASSRAEYWRQLEKMDVVFSTADHEFFGIAVCEAMWAGAIAFLPNRLSYPELVDESNLYQDLDDAVVQLKKLAHLPRQPREETRRPHPMQRFLAHHCVGQLDALLCDVLSR